jgi:hypothetical protein
MGKDIASKDDAPADLEPTSYGPQPAARRTWHNIFQALTWLRAYQPRWLRADLIAGVTLAAYLMPAGLADASLANLPPEAGLYACSRDSFSGCSAARGTQLSRSRPLSQCWLEHPSAISLEATLHDSGLWLRVRP